MMNLYNVQKFLNVIALAPGSLGGRVKEKAAELIVQFQEPIIMVAALAAIIRIGYPFIWGDEQDQRTAKKRVPWIILGMAIVSGAVYWANYVHDFVAF